MKALLLIDIQNDFLPGGALAVEEGDRIIPIINEIIHYPFDLIIASKDWHPHDHMSFADNHEGKNVGDHIHLAGLDQILWPAHCVQGTIGSEFAPGWDTTQVDKVIYKGMDPLLDSYSVFYDNGHLHSTGLENYLKEKGVKEIYIAGLATDYCIKFSALDASELGFQVFVILDACRGVNLQPHDIEKACEKMRFAGAALISCRDLKNFLNV